MSTVATEASVRSRLVLAATESVAATGSRKLNLSDIATRAGVSRPTLYRYFPDKDSLLAAISAAEKDRFTTELSQAMAGLSGAARLDRALEFIVQFQREQPFRRIIQQEPAFILEQLEEALRTMAEPLVRVFDEILPETDGRSSSSADLADLVVRVSSSHYLIAGRDDQLLRQLRHVVGLDFVAG